MQLKTKMRSHIQLQPQTWQEQGRGVAGGMQDSVATREGYLVVSHKLNIHLTTAPGQPMAGYLHQRNESTVFTGFVYDCQKLETTHMSFLCWVSDTTVVLAVEVTWWAARGVSCWPPSAGDASQGRVPSDRSRYCTAWVRSYDTCKGNLLRQKTAGWLPGTAELDYRGTWRNVRDAKLSYILIVVVVTWL